MIELKNISKSYFTGEENETLVLKGISLSVEDGEFVAIMGPSGSGKSTLMNIIGALDVPTSGEYFLDDKNVGEMSDDELADVRKDKIGFVFQSFNLLPRATVLRNVMIPLVYDESVRPEEREKLARRVLAEVGIEESRYFHTSNQISGGQMQRVAIARALVNNPSIILADEPTGNLDSKTGDLIMKTFKRLNREQKRTILLITHEEYVAGHADRIIRLKDGEILSDEKT